MLIKKGCPYGIYGKKPRKRTTTTRNKDNIKHHHHHYHHYHHLHVHELKKSQGNDKRAELLSYSKHLHKSKKLEASPSTSTHHRPKSLEASTRKDQETLASVLLVENKQKLKRQPSRLNMNKIFKCFATSHAKRKVEKKKKKSSESSAKKASAIMKTFNAKT
ncbi:hypothetical protein Tco_0754936 [Tanacetum coccineum]